MSAGLPRRGFLSGLIGLPLIGGGISLIGAPTASAEPITLDLLQNYCQWLWGEHYRCGRELEALGLPGLRFKHVANSGAAFHTKPDWNWSSDVAPASARAAIVLGAVGVDWREPPSWPKQWDRL